MDAHTVAEAFERKLKERASLRSNSSGVLLIALGGAAAAECSLLAATARAHMAVGADGRRLQIVVMTDRAAHSRLSAPDNELARSLFDGVLPLPADALSAAHKLGAVNSKLATLVHTPFDYTLHLDCDMSIERAEGPGDLLALAMSADADVVFGDTALQAGGAPRPAAPGGGSSRMYDPFAHGRAGVCACVIAYARLSAVHELWRGALRRFDTPGRFHPDVGLRREQEAMWAELEARSHSTAASLLSVRTVPLEWQCPAMLPGGPSGRGRPQLEYAGSGIPPRKCRFTHASGGRGHHDLSVLLPAYARELVRFRLPHADETLRAIERVAGVSSTPSTPSTPRTPRTPRGVASSATCPIIVMGLPKTGTSSAAEAIERLGYDMVHYAPSAAPLGWPGCDGLANAAEHDYEELHARYPCADWVVTHSSNVTAWLGSLRTQLKKNYLANGRTWRCPATERIFGSHTDVARAVHAKHGLSPPGGCKFDAEYFAAFYREYYRRLFAFFTQRGNAGNGTKPYRLVDARRGDGWRELAPIRGRCPATPDAPYPMANSRAGHTSDYIGRCRDPAGWAAEWWLGLRPKPTRPHVEAEKWTQC